MKAIEVLRNLMKNDLIWISERTRLTIACGEVIETKTYLKRDAPDLGKADCVIIEDDNKVTYLYLLEN